MEQDKTKILSDLYAIRATMSVVACNQDKIVHEILKYKEEYLSQQKSDFYCKILGNDSVFVGYNTEKNLQPFLNHCRRRKNGLRKEIKEWQEKLSELEKKIFPFYKRAEKKLNRIEIENAKERIEDAISEIAYMDKSEQKAKMFIHDNPIAVFEICREDYYCVNEERTRRLKSQYADAEERYRRYATSIENVDVTLIDVIQFMTIDSKDSVRKMNLSSIKIIDSAVKTYPLIDFRDWENVDLLIYYFETGRADDMKEALQLVDRQRQTDQIVEAVESASESICKSIDRSMRQLGNALSQSFGVLSKQMAQQHVELMAGMERQADEQRQMAAAQLSEIRAQTAEQRNTQAMNRALLEKISDSSLHLARQMDRQMREVHGIY